MTSDLLDQLNDQQRAAVTAPDGPALVIAAAGTGKTRTLTHRVAWLVQEHGIRPWQILLLTFTNRAAKEMLERAGQLLRGGIESIWGGTFHSVANRMLRHHAERLGYDRSFSILDEDDSSRLIKQCISDLGFNKVKNFPKANVLLSLFGLASSRKADLRETLETRFTPQADDSDNDDLQSLHLPLIATSSRFVPGTKSTRPRMSSSQFSNKVDIDGMMQVHELYERKKHELQSMDFDDLLINGLRLLQECPDVAEHYSQTFRHVLVDEYQDTSRIQSDFVDLLAAGHDNLMAVGDDFQSIYSWRGADIDNFLDFTKRHPGTRLYTLDGKRRPQARTFMLELNYRSVPGVLDVANDVIAGNPEQPQKTLRPTRTENLKPVLAELSDGRHQARYVVEKVMELVQSGKARPGEIAILYRSHFHAMDLQLELARAQIPYTVVSGVRFFEQVHIKDLCAPLLLAENTADGIAFTRWMELLPKVGPKRAQSMWTKLGGRIDLRDPAARSALAAALPSDARPVWQEIESALFPRGETSLLDHPDKLIEAFVDVFYRDYAKANFENYRSRKEDISGLCSFASQYATTSAFLDEMTLQTNLDVPGYQSSNNDGSPVDTLRLSTVHQAKGLEWKAVFVLWMAQGMFPSMRALNEPGTMSEERRLFYVAVTRAKDYLWLCSPKFRFVGGSMQYCERSLFLDEISKDKLSIERPVTPAPAWRGSDWYN